MNLNSDEEEIKFSKQSESYCVCIIDIVNSTKVTANMNSEDVRNYYSTFINSQLLLHETLVRRSSRMWETV